MGYSPWGCNEPHTNEQLNNNWPHSCWMCDWADCLHPVTEGGAGDTSLLSSPVLWEPREFPGGSAGKESACTRGEPALIPGLGSCPGEGIGYPLQYSWASLVVQTVNSMQAMWETWVQSLGWEDPLEEGMAPYSIFLPRESPWTEEPGGPQSMGSQRVRQDEATKYTHSGSPRP